nr:PHP domain-containing protein [Paraburkholderia podalyriae]
MDSTFSALPDYAELFCFSNFTFLHGASHAEELAERAAQLGYSALAITDECSLAGVVRAHVAAKEAKLHCSACWEFGNARAKCDIWLRNGSSTCRIY